MRSEYGSLLPTPKGLALLRLDGAAVVLGDLQRELLPTPKGLALLRPNATAFRLRSVKYATLTDP